MPTPMKPRYTLANLQTSDPDLVLRSQSFRKSTGYTHEDIYKRGLEELIKENTKVS